jgi:cysteine synthase B
MALLDFHPPQTNTTFLTDLTAQVGNTPLLPLRRITSGLPAGVQVFAKAEWFNPGGSVKDRPAMNIIREALANGQLTEGRRLLDSTSGNMGIAYATFGSALGIPVTLVVPANASPERIAILRALGAELKLSDALEGSDGAILMAQEMAAEEPERYWYANQYDNAANWQAHYQSTGPEILAQTQFEVTHFVAGIGTSGTLRGTGQRLREHKPGVQIIGLQPDAAFHGLEGLKHIPTAIRPGIYDDQAADRMLSIQTEPAHEMVRRLAREEGMFAGISSGAAAVAALRVAKELTSGVVVTLFPDAGYKYLSDSKLWSG